jgi:hypothetical protein
LREPRFAEGALWVFHGPRGVIHITWAGVDKAGFNQLLAPYQHPLLSSLLSHNTLSTMSPIHNSYIIPFKPIVAHGPTILTAAQEHNREFKDLKQGSLTNPYPDPLTVYRRSALTNPGDDMFEDLYLNDLYVLVAELLANSTNRNNRIKSFKRISCHWLMVDANIPGSLRGLFERGVQVCMDAEEVKDTALKVAIGYAGSVGTSLWSEIKEDRAQVGLAQFFNHLD